MKKKLVPVICNGNDIKQKLYFSFVKKTTMDVSPIFYQLSHSTDKKTVMLSIKIKIININDKINIPYRCLTKMSSTTKYF